VIGTLIQHLIARGKLLDAKHGKYCAKATGMKRSFGTIIDIADEDRYLKYQ